MKNKLRIAIDKDDTLNWLTHEIALRSGKKDLQPEDIPSFKEIKAAATVIQTAMKNKVTLSDDLLVDFPNVDLAFLEMRQKCFADPMFFAAKPYGLAHTIVDMAKTSGFEPVICTKTLSQHEKFAEVTAAKMVFWKEHFSDIDMMIATGEKCIDAIALIDDLAKNGLSFNASNHRPFLVWNHITGNERLLEDFYSYCHTYATYLESDIELTSFKNVLVKKSGDTVELSVISDQETSGLVSGGSMIEHVSPKTKSCSIINLFFQEIDSGETFDDIESLRFEPNSLNSIIFNNFNI